MFFYANIDLFPSPYQAAIWPSFTWETQQTSIIRQSFIFTDLHFCFDLNMI